MITDQCFSQMAEFNEWLKKHLQETETIVTSQAVQDLMFRAWCAGQELAVQKLSKTHRGK